MQQTFEGAEVEVIAVSKQMKQLVKQYGTTWKISKPLASYDPRKEALIQTLQLVHYGKFPFQIWVTLGTKQNHEADCDLQLLCEVGYWNVRTGELIAPRS